MKLDKPTQTCLECGSTDIQPMAYWTGDGWELAWGCDKCGMDGLHDLGWDKYHIDWPFDDFEWGGQENLEALGFTVV